MTMIAAILLIFVFTVLAGIHIYWVLGGKWGSDVVLPTKNDHVKVIMPGILPTLIVAFGLLCFSYLVLMQVTSLKFPFGHNLAYHYGLWMIASIFLIRAIGEFNFIGIFKKVKHTKFGQYDTRYFSPLCLLLSILALILEFNN